MIGPTSMSFDIRDIPFSVRGAWFNLSPVVAPHTRVDTVHLVAHKNGLHGVLGMQPHRDGTAVEATWLAGVARFLWRSGETAEVAATFDGTSAIRLRGTGLGLRI